MEAPCVRVPRADGEAVRSRLADADAIDRRYRIHADDGAVYIPVRPDADLPPGLEVVEAAVEPRTSDTLPRDLLDEDPSYERLGEIALIDEDGPDHARAVADALVDSSLPIRTVLNSRSKVKGEQRVRDWERLAGSETTTVHREFGAAFALDVTDVYFSPRLATERHRVVSQIEPDEQVFDMFAGVGPFLVPAAMQGAIGVGVDVNPDAIRFLEENAARNDVTDRITAINDDVRAVADEYAEWADRVIMNLPHRADAFLATAGTLAADRCVLHYYDIQPADDPFAAGRESIDDALGDTFEIEILREHVVRSYAPHEDNICLDVRLVRR